MRRNILGMLLLFASIAAGQERSPDGVWEVVRNPMKFMGAQPAAEDGVAYLRLLRKSITDALIEAPRAGVDTRQRVIISLPLPLPKGGASRWVDFAVEEAPLLSPSLAEKLRIRSYRAWGAQDSTLTARFNVTPRGVTGIILTPQETYFVTPIDERLADITGEKSLHINLTSERAAEVIGSNRPQCLVRTAARPLAERRSASRGVPAVVRRRYTLAVAATGEYTKFHAAANPSMDAKSAAATAITDTIALVQAVYERDLAIDLQLTDKLLDLIHTDPATDPYKGGDIVVENQVEIDRVLTSEGYDIGQVFTVGPGGAAVPGCVCDDKTKAMGFTGLDIPSAWPPFAIDYVAHEIGHQFGADHTFNGTDGNCGGDGNRVPTSAFEPGSGSTIMGYAGICNSQNLAEHSHDYFHARSLEQISNFIQAGGDRCAERTATKNRPPTVTGQPAFSIPAQTPIVLTATGKDPDGDPLTYVWEEYYPSSFAPPFAAEAAPPDDDADGKSRPLIHSTNTASIPVFYYMNKTVPTFLGQVLPRAREALNARVTARDHNGGFGSHDIRLNVVRTAGPFKVTAPGANDTVATGASRQVQWDVAGTKDAPISTANVRILLSLDGGATFPHVLAASVPNAGSASVNLPLSAAGSGARIRVEAIGNIFFADSEPFRISAEAK